MQALKAAEGQSLIDLCLQKYGTLEALFVFAGANSLALDQELSPGQNLIVPDFRAPRDQYPVYKIPETLIINQNIISEGQSLFDLVIQEAGSLEGLFGFIAANGLNITSSLLPGEVVKLPEDKVVNRPLRNYFRSQRVRINSGLRPEPEADLPDGIYLVDADGAYLTDADGAYLIAE